MSQDYSAKRYLQNGYITFIFFFFPFFLTEHILPLFHHDPINLSKQETIISSIMSASCSYFGIIVLLLVL